MVESGADFPALVVRPESLWDKLGQVFGLHDISLPSDEFNRRFFVKCADPGFAIRALSQPAMDFLLQQAHPPNRPLAIEALEHAVLLHHAGNFPLLQIPGGVQGLMDVGIELLSQLESGLGIEPPKS